MAAEGSIGGNLEKSPLGLFVPVCLLSLALGGRGDGSTVIFWIDRVLSPRSGRPIPPRDLPSRPRMRMSLL